MSTILAIQPDPVLDAAREINESGERIALVMADQITRAIRAVAPINATFWSDPRIGTNGVPMLQKLSAHIQFLATHYPAHINATIQGAGQYLTPHQDGTVTYDPPPPPEPEPEPPSE